MEILASIKSSQVKNTEVGDKVILLTLQTEDTQSIRLLQLPADTLLKVNFTIEDTEG